MPTRRTFLKTAAGLVASAAFINQVGAALPSKEGEMIWANLLHLGGNMWGDHPGAYTPCSDKLKCQDDVWKELTDKMAAAKLNMVVIDLGEGVKYESHPELAVEGSWSVDKLRKELDRLRKMGLEPIPKLNFSACHDHWLGEYSRMVSTKKYYEVCADLIKEVCEIFDSPRFFHLGYDEETSGHQSTFHYVVVRQGDLWWHDFLYFVKTVEDQHVRPWIWSDYCWHHKDEFLARMPKSVLQSNWYYNMEFDFPAGDESAKNTYVQTFEVLDKAGFDQVPTGSNWSHDQNFPKLVEYCQKVIAPERLKGFLQTGWHHTERSSLKHMTRAIELTQQAMAEFAEAQKK